VFQQGLGERFDLAPMLLHQIGGTVAKLEPDAETFFLILRVELPQNIADPEDVGNVGRCLRKSGEMSLLRAKTVRRFSSLPSPSSSASDRSVFTRPSVRALRLIETFLMAKP
jgi:hypothetical protein